MDWRTTAQTRTDVRTRSEDLSDQCSRTSPTASRGDTKSQAGSLEDRAVPVPSLRTKSRLHREASRPDRNPKEGTLADEIQCQTVQKGCACDFATGEAAQEPSTSLHNVRRKAAEGDERKGRADPIPPVPPPLRQPPKWQPLRSSLEGRPPLLAVEVFSG